MPKVPWGSFRLIWTVTKASASIGVTLLPSGVAKQIGGDTTGANAELAKAEQLDPNVG